MLAFLESSLSIDASGLNVGGVSNNFTYFTLSLDRRSATPASCTVDIYDESNVKLTANFPFTITTQSISASKIIFKITFDQPVANVKVGAIRKITIKAASGDTADVNLQVNYSGSYQSALWANSDDTLETDDIDLRGPLTSKYINNRLKNILYTALAGVNRALEIVKKFNFKERYLSDLVDAIVLSGANPESSTNAIAYNADGSINTITSTYSTRTRFPNVKTFFTYASTSIQRVIKRSGSETYLTAETISVLSGIRVDAVDENGNTIFNIANVSITRNPDWFTYSSPFLKDYNDTLPIETRDSDPDNILSDYKYYRTHNITGWTVVE